MRDFSLRFVTRPRCHLCEDAAAVLERVAGRLRVPVETLNIEEDDALLREYALRIPVLLGPDGEVVAEGIFDERQLRKSVRRLKRG